MSISIVTSSTDVQVAETGQPTLVFPFNQSSRFEGYSELRGSVEIYMIVNSERRQKTISIYDLTINGVAFSGTTATLGKKLLNDLFVNPYSGSDNNFTQAYKNLLDSLIGIDNPNTV